MKIVSPILSDSGAVLRAKELALGRLTRDYAWWDLVIEHVLVSLDSTWAADNIGTHLSENFGTSVTLVLDADNATVYASVDGDEQVTFALDNIEADLSSVLAQARASVTDNGPEPLTLLSRVGEDTHMIAVSAISPEYFDRPTAPEARDSVLILTRRLSSEYFEKLGEDYGFPGMSLAKDEVPGAVVALPLIGVDGVELARITWHPKLPGPRLLLEILPVVAAGFLTMAIYVAVLVYRTRRIAVDVENVANNLARQNEALRKADADLRQAKDVAEKASAAKTRFLAAASHDLRQPIQAIELFHTTMTSFPNNEKQAVVLREMGSAITSMSDLLNSLLSISKLDAGVIRPTLGDFPVQSLFSRMKTEFGVQSDAKGISFRVVSSSAYVHSDLSMLEVIVRNFLSNALRCTPNGKIVLGCRRSDNGLRLEVWDNGCGIPEEAMSEIFEEFYQINDTERESGWGLGLGLAIAERVARLLDHGIGANSVRGKGSQFFVEVPLCAPGAEPTEPQSLSAIPIGDLEGYTIVLVEDNAEVLTSLQLLLESWRVTVIAAQTIDSARQQLANHANHADLVIADHRLKGEDTGLLAIEQVQKSVGRKIPAIILTGDTAPEILRTMEGTGYHVLHKPIKATKLHPLLRHFLRAH